MMIIRNVSWAPNENIRMIFVGSYDWSNGCWKFIGINYILKYTRIFIFILNSNISQYLREAGHRLPTIMYSIWKRMCFLNIKACQHILIHQIMIFKKASYDPFKLIGWLLTYSVFSSYSTALSLCGCAHPCRLSAIPQYVTDYNN